MPQQKTRRKSSPKHRANRKPIRSSFVSVTPSRRVRSAVSVQSRAKKSVSPTRKRTVRKPGKDHGALPSWRDLNAPRNVRVSDRKKFDSFFGSISTIRAALIVAVLAVSFTLYVGHVHATQQLYAEVMQLRSANAQLRLEYNRVKGEFDRATGPSEINRLAAQLGLAENDTHSPTVYVR